MKLLEIKDLEVCYNTLKGTVRAVDGVDLDVDKGEIKGLAGESGCGKTTLALSIMNLLPSVARIRKGSISLNGEDLVKMNESSMRKIRGRRISMIFQQAMNALNPVKTIGDQVAEPILVHSRADRTDKPLIEKTKDLFRLVGLNPSRLKEYPHQFSGGMKQRAMIAMSLACNPELVIADEPLTALDLVTQVGILDLMKELQRKLNLSMIFVTHDLPVLAEVADKVAVMYAGKIVEDSDVATIFKSPAHPYTQRLMKSMPSIKTEERVEPIPGTPPDLINCPSGCRFQPRCTSAKDICKREDPPLVEMNSNHRVACHLVQAR
jgi:peptide/nickel transport system ATP-binding protein